MDISNKPADRTPEIDVWWADAYRVNIRQENGDTADVITLSLGQTYDLMRTFARALECGPAD